MKSADADENDAVTALLSGERERRRHMKAGEKCINCLRRNGERMTGQADFPAEKREEARERIEQILAKREVDTAPELYTEIISVVGEYKDVYDMYREIKKSYNDLLLSLEDEITEEIRSSSDPLFAGIQYAIMGNYIDVSSPAGVQEERFKELMRNRGQIKVDETQLQKLREQLACGHRLLYIADNAGEIVLDKFFIRVLKELYPQLEIAVMVRGDVVLNDATVEDALLVGMDQVAEIVSNGTNVAGTPLERLGAEAKEWFETSDIRIAKGQGNFETLHGTGEDVFFLFLCKCSIFHEMFDVEPLAPMLVNEQDISERCAG